MTQIKAGLIKEWMFFWRGFRFIGLIITFIGCAAMYPAMSWLMIMMTDMMSSDMGDIPGMEGIDDLSGLFTMELSYVGSLQMFTSTAIIVILILLVGTAGSEQKKRSIVLPQTAGLSPSGYVIPKFLFYPPLVFVLTLLSSILTDALSHLVFKDSLPFETVVLTGSLYALFLMFLTCLYLFFGVSLAQPGLSVIYVLGGSMVISLMFSLVFKIDRFTPWNLTTMSDIMVFSSGMVETQSIVITVVITFALCVLLTAGTLFVMTAKQMDNTADEIY
jgi:ABC-2 type transport system permease protein